MQADQNCASGDGLTHQRPIAIRNPHERFSMRWWGRVLFSQSFLVDTLASDLTLRCLVCVCVCVRARVCVPQKAVRPRKARET
jgi:hypothetical protein